MDDSSASTLARGMQKYKLVFFIPHKYTQIALQHLFVHFPHNVGRIGAYGGCAFVSRGIGQFLPLEGANPVIGSVGKPETVEEDRVEVLVRFDGGTASHSDSVASATVDMRAVLRELKKVHPYEEVAYDVYKLEDF